MVEVNNISKSFGEIAALRDISFSTGNGEIFGVIGPDGAGKTTLFRIIVSLMIPDKGTVKVLGYDAVSQYREIRKRVGYMAGRFSLYHDLTVEQNLKFYATVFGSTIEENYDLIKDVYIQIEPFRKRLAGRLSGGMKQKLALSCALIHRPELLVLDEPTTGVDAVSRREFWDLLKNIKKEGINIIVSTPYMDEAHLCDRIGLIQNGSFLSISTPSDIYRNFDKPVFEVVHERGSYYLLKELRETAWCHTAWMFGQTVHVTLRSEEDVIFLREYAENKSINITRIKAGIEDTFMELMKGA